MVIMMQQVSVPRHKPGRLRCRVVRADDSRRVGLGFKDAQELLQRPLIDANVGVEEHDAGAPRDVGPAIAGIRGGEGTLPGKPNDLVGEFGGTECGRVAARVVDDDQLPTSPIQRVRVDSR